MEIFELILITGCARSGTSLTTGILAACGANIGSTNALNEATAVRDGVIKPYLRLIGADPMGQKPLPSIDDIEIDPDWRNKVLSALNHPAEPWAYKAAKACLMWPLWAHAFPDAKWVIVRRAKDSIVDSCMRTTFMSAYKNRKGWEQWVDHHIERFEEMKSELNCFEVWPDMDAETFRPMVEWCGLEFDKAKVDSVINPSKWHGDK